jgi:hypothetical protein
MFLLTVAHVTDNNGNWAIQLEYDRAQGAKCFQIGALNYLMSFSLPNATANKVDFAYALVPTDLKAYRHFLTPQGDTLAKHEVTVYPSPFFDLPSSDGEFAFAGAVMPKIANNIFQPERPILDTELRAYTGLKYLRTESDFHVFKLPFDHPGHIHFQGCSGSPILTEAGRPVALVSWGDEKAHEIYGVALDRLMPIIEATL